jgi:2-(1,2-epoxy-1,2-dihydrophenyl)acetyl-CoA isomerase
MSAVLYESEGGIATITLNRPQALNSLDAAMIAGLKKATADAEADEAIRVVIIRGAGDHFMAGGDLKWFREELAQHGAGGADEVERQFAQRIADVHDSTRAIRRMGKPVVAQVHGAVAGFGLSLMLSCDFAIAADSAYFTLAYRHIGLSPDGGATWSLPRLVGLRKASEIALLGDRFDAAAARDLGLVNRVVAADELAGETRAFAGRFLGASRGAIARTKALLGASFERSLDEQLDAEQASFARCAAEPDFAEGLAAFVEKRKPNFR